MGLILTAGYAAFFLFLVSRSNFFRIDGIKPSTIKAAFIVKFLAGIALGLVYTYYYTDRLTADTYKYFDDGALLFSLFHTDPVSYFKILTGFGQVTPEMQMHIDKLTNWYDTFSPFNDNRTMIRLNSLLMFISMGYYYVHVAFISFLSFTGIVAITKSFVKFHPELSREFFIVLIMLPSTLFWCSGLLKDSLTLFVLGIFIYNISMLVTREKNRFNFIIPVIFLLLLLMITKFQIFMLMIPVAASVIFIRSFKTNPILNLTISGITFTILLLLVDYLALDQTTLKLLHDKQAAFFKLAVESDAGSLINIPVFEPSVKGLLFSLPSGLFTGVFRPFITDTRNVMMTISAVENTGILLFAIYSIRYMNASGIMRSVPGVFSLYFAMSSFALIGIMTPVLGALVRYKALALPFFVMFFIIIVRENKSPVTKLCDMMKL